MIAHTPDAGAGTNGKSCEETQEADIARMRRKALARWENEGGLGTGIPRDTLDRAGAHPEVPKLTNAELSQLHIRVIALEGLLTAMLADASDRQLDLARGMAAYILPRPGAVDHPLTIRAATQMIDLLKRADRVRSKPTTDASRLTDLDDRAVHLQTVTLP